MRHAKGKQVEAQMRRKQAKEPQRLFFAALICVIVFLSILSAMVTAMSPKRYVLQVGDIPTETITAPKDVVDELSRSEAIQKARDSVEMVYTQDKNKSEEVVGNMQAFFGSMEAVYDYGQSVKSLRQPPAGQTEEGNAAAAQQWYDRLTNNDYKKMRERMEMEGISEQTLRDIVTLNKTELERMREVTIGRVQEELSSGLKEEMVTTQTEKIVREIGPTLYFVPQNVLMLTQDCVRTYMAANLFENIEETEKKRDEMEEEVGSFLLKAGQNIVEKGGSPVTEAQAAMLDSLGLLDKKEARIDFLFYLGIGAFLALMIGGFAVYILIYEKHILKDRKQILLLAIIMVLTVGIGLLLTRLEPGLMAVAFASMLLTIIFSSHLAMAATFVLSAVVSAMVNANGLFTTEMVSMFFVYLMGGLAACMYVKNVQRRSSLMVAGLVVGAVNIVTISAVGLITTSDYMSILENAGWSLASALLSSVLCLGTLPVWESFFDVLTTTKLLELAAPSQPLLKRMMLEAPGTYHHSILVANLAESAVEEIGGNPFLARIGAYYHDVGKLKRPYFYTENQMGVENPHDKLSPQASSKAITLHPRDGLQMAQKYNLPKQIQDLITQHHGTTAVQYFYHKAMKQDGEDTNINMFRYPGPKPRSKEAAVIMLADTVEAAVRSMPSHKTEEIEQKVRSLIKARIDDDQLSEAPITFSDINAIVRAFMKVFNGMYHERIEYPDMNQTKETQDND